MALPQAGIEGLPAWIGVKILLWLILGSAILVVSRRPRSAYAMWLLVPAIGGLAAWVGINHGL